jgi:hypothetical protein
VNAFDVGSISWFLVLIKEIAHGVAGLRRRHGGDAPVPDDMLRRFTDLLDQTEEMFSTFQFQSAIERLPRVRRAIHFDPTIARFQSELDYLANEILGELNAKTFLYVADDRKAYILSLQPLFGNKVYANFPSARFDIGDAGKCLAVELNTAAVFHLMRVAEIGLRTLAWDRRVKVLQKNREIPLDLATWEEIIRELEKAETAIQGFKKTHAREAQFEFYHGAMMEFKRFKNVFRNRVMHTREEYDRDQAHSVFTHVRDFMKILAGKIAEGKRTPIVWTTR